MSHGPITIAKAEWDLRHKTKLIHVEGSVFVKSSFADVNVKENNVKENASPPINDPIKDKILLLNVSIENDDGPMKVQPSGFHFTAMTQGDEPWTHVQVISGDESTTIPITVLSYKK